jgi:hypothetical protein
MINVSKLGFNSLLVRQTDSVNVVLTDRTAVFLDTPLNAFSASYRATRAAYTNYFPITVPEFSVTGAMISFRCHLKESRLRFWLVDAAVCPDLSNMALPKTDYFLEVETRVIGLTCVFSSTSGASYRATIETGVGLPEIRFFSARGHGKPVKTCCGESDLCIWESYQPFFLSFHGATKVNFTYQVDGLSERPMQCGLAGIPTMDRSSFKDAAPKINITYSECLTKTHGLTEASFAMFFITLMGVAIAVLARLILERSGVPYGDFNTGNFICAHFRRIYGDCT